MGHHHSSEELAAYLSGKLSQQSRARFESHIADCRACRLETTSARRLLDTSRSQRSRWIIPSALAAVGMVAFASMIVRDDGARTGRTVERVGTGVETVGMVAPVDGQSVAANPTFTWRAAGNRTLYRLSIADGSGTLVWGVETRDTVVAIPSSESLREGLEYLWTVTATDVDGVQSHGNTRRFRVIR